jgi:hypothetical protein
MKKILATLMIVMAATLTAFGEGKGDKEVKDCDRAHERAEHNIAERIVERAFPDVERAHEKQTREACEMDKARQP